ncbi:MAG: hypothetical protein K9N51_10630 [Candidatus Pacebacteria bacterium]|nr:hypothetical protein [Candidatus Paceibacterota bacterium]
MSRTEPRAYLRLLVAEWPLIDAIFERSRSGPVQSATLQQLARESETPGIVQRLIDEGIISQLPNSPAYEMGEFVRGLIEHLKREHTLGLAEEIRVYLQDLENHTSKIVEAIETANAETLHRHVELLANRIRTIRHHLQTNSGAVREMVVRAKTRKAQTSILERYAEVLEAWEDYIEPVQEMADTRGPFETLFERLERELNRATESVVSQGGLVSELKNLEVLQFRLNAMRTDLLEHMGESRDLLLPLVREIRRNSLVARGASVALKKLRSEGTAAMDLPSLIPINRRRAPTAVACAAAIEQYLADVSAYSPEPVSFECQSDEDVSPPKHISVDDVADRLKSDLPVTDLFGWLIEMFGDVAGTDDLVDLFFNSQQIDDGMQFARESRHEYETATHLIKAPGICVTQAKESNDSRESGNHAD